MPSILESSDDPFEIVDDPSSVSLFINVAAVRERQASILRDRLASLLAQGRTRIAVGVEPVSDLCSAALAAIVEASRACSLAAGGSLALFGPSKDLRRLFRVTGLDDVVIVRRDRREALRALDPSHRRLFSFRRAA